MSINKVVLEHSHAHLFMNCVCAFMLQQQRWVRSRSGDGGGTLPVAAQGTANSSDAFAIWQCFTSPYCDILKKLPMPTKVRNGDFECCLTSGIWIVLQTFWMLFNTVDCGLSNKVRGQNIGVITQWRNCCAKEYITVLSTRLSSQLTGKQWSQKF